MANPKTADKRKTSNSPGTKTSGQRPVDVYFKRYSQSHQSQVNRTIRCVSIPLLLFGLFGLLWAIPFPHLGFLGSYNGYFNWASFLIAFAVYFYSRLSPTLSYLMLLLLLGFSYGVIKLLEWQNAGGPSLWLASLLIAALAFAAQVTGAQTEGKKYPLKDNLEFLLISPIWLLHLVLKKFSARY